MEWRKMILPNLLDEMQSDALPDGTRIAKNKHNASHIANGLKLTECNTLDECRVRWRRYRGWKIGGENTQAAYRRAIDGEEPPVSLFVCVACGRELVNRKCPNDDPSIDGEEPPAPMFAEAATDEG